MLLLLPSFLSYWYVIHPQSPAKDLFKQPMYLFSWIRLCHISSSGNSQLLNLRCQTIKFNQGSLSKETFFLIKLSDIIRSPYFGKQEQCAPKYISCVNIGDNEVSRKVFDVLPQRGIDAWNAMIIAYSRSEYPDEVLNLYRQIIFEGVRPDNDNMTFTVAHKECVGCTAPCVQPTCFCQELI